MSIGSGHRGDPGVYPIGLPRPLTRRDDNRTTHRLRSARGDPRCWPRVSRTGRAGGRHRRRPSRSVHGARAFGNTPSFSDVTSCATPGVALPLVRELDSRSLRWTVFEDSGDLDRKVYPERFGCRIIVSVPEGPTHGVSSRRPRRSRPRSDTRPPFDGGVPGRTVNATPDLSKTAH